MHVYVGHFERVENFKTCGVVYALFTFFFVICIFQRRVMLGGGGGVVVVLQL
jgi:hypothetical protein